MTASTENKEQLRYTFLDKIVEEHILTIMPSYTHRLMRL